MVDPFIMNPEGVGRIFAPLSAFADGPFPEHYEPIESPIDNPFHPQQTHNPVVKRFKTGPGQISTPRRRTVTRLSAPDLSPDRALSLLDEEQSDERAVGAGTLCGNPR